ncbi:hypothetical protein AC578_2864 [Pseudocercospora eumusae]|uniref:Uncharacterized protein n=1 Tax=Pseudocercospora eumusae TaxID=321146 RepID=A0A139H3J9_9PEZI|nr:hypothetical protein AC578_2864 [Pseudocercospora eumusae]
MRAADLDRITKPVITVVHKGHSCRDHLWYKFSRVHSTRLWLLEIVYSSDPAGMPDFREYGPGAKSLIGEISTLLNASWTKDMEFAKKMVREIRPDCLASAIWNAALFFRTYRHISCGVAWKWCGDREVES